MTGSIEAKIAIFQWGKQAKVLLVNISEITVLPRQLNVLEQKTKRQKKTFVQPTPPPPQVRYAPPPPPPPPPSYHYIVNY